MKTDFIEIENIALLALAKYAIIKNLNIYDSVAIFT